MKKRYDNPIKDIETFKFMKYIDKVTFLNKMKRLQKERKSSNK